MTATAARRPELRGGKAIECLAHRETLAAIRCLGADEREPAGGAGEADRYGCDLQPSGEHRPGRRAAESADLIDGDVGIIEPDQVVHHRARGDGLILE